MSVGTTSIITPEDRDDSWTSGELWHITINTSSLETIVDDLESEVLAAVGRAKGEENKQQTPSNSSHSMYRYQKSLSEDRLASAKEDLVAMLQKTHQPANTILG